MAATEANMLMKAQFDAVIAISKAIDKGEIDSRSFQVMNKLITQDAIEMACGLTQEGN